MRERERERERERDEPVCDEKDLTKNENDFCCR